MDRFDPCGEEVDDGGQARHEHALEPILSLAAFFHANSTIRERYTVLHFAVEMGVFAEAVEGAVRS